MTEIQKEKILKRNEVPEELTWRLEDIYNDITEWEAEIREAEETAGKIGEYKGHLTESPASLLKAMKLYEKCCLLIDRFAGFAHMKSDQDTADTDNQSIQARSGSVMVRIDEELSFFEPELLELSGERLDEFFEEEQGLRRYENYIRECFRKKKHSLSAEMEKLLASAGEMANVPQRGFSMLINADLKFPSVDHDGEMTALTNGRFVKLQMNNDRDFRKKVFEAYYGRYKEFANTWAALYEGQVKKQIFFARARKYDSTFEAAVDQNNVSPAVCDNLIESVHRGMDKMHRYTALRRKELGLDELHMYDVYVPIVSDHDISVTYEEAQKMTLEALAPLGEEYCDLVRMAFRGRWIDVLENEGKRGGAYSSGVYDVHPYMLLNWNGTLEDVFTLVHEMGHSIHTWYSTHNQPYLDSNYKIFVAEVASTTNEVLLLEYLLKKAETDTEKKYLINHYLESFKSTLYRQTMFEEFERKTNTLAEQGVPLTADELCTIYYELNQEYFGPAMVSDPLIAYEWCRIPHFYYNFYVYQYATSYAASVAMAHRILEQGEPAVEKYKEFLKSGCTSDPVTLLKTAGVDLSDGTPVDEALKVFDEAISEFEALT